MRKLYLLLLFFTIPQFSYSSDPPDPSDSHDPLGLQDPSDLNDDIILSYFGNTLTPEYLAPGAEYSTPYYIISSDENSTPEPIIVIDGGMHGDEVAGIYACDDLLINLKVTKGTVIIVPRLNKPACDRTTRTRNVNFNRNYDMNRNFPGSTDRNTSYYEAIVADEFTNMIKKYSPSLVLNLHEDKDFNDLRINRYDCEDFYMGQVLITCRGRCENFDFNSTIEDTMLLKAQRLINSGMAEDHKFTIINLPSAPEKGYSQDYFYEVLGIDSYTLETYRNGSFGSGQPVFEYGYELENRVKLQIITCLSFMKTYGVEYEYADEENLNTLTAPVRY